MKNGQMMGIVKLLLVAIFAVVLTLLIAKLLCTIIPNFPCVL